MQSQSKYPPIFSIEVFPPKTQEGQIKLQGVCEELAALNPSYVSVTYGAGGSTQKGSLTTVTDLMEAGYDVAPHLSCIGSSKKSIRDILGKFVDLGIKRIVALRGDMPSGMIDAGEFRYANELVSFIREETGSHFYIEVAAYPDFHPQATDAFIDIENFKRKVDAGADAAITQYFYNADSYFRFVEDCEKHRIDIPIVPGIMPITNYDQLARFSDICGSEIPMWIKKRLIAFGDDIASIRRFGLDVTINLCQQLLDGGSPGLHFFTLNQAGPTTEIWKALNLKM